MRGRVNRLGLVEDAGRLDALLTPKASHKYLQVLSIVVCVEIVVRRAESDGAEGLMSDPHRDLIAMAPTQDGTKHARSRMGAMDASMLFVRSLSQ